MNKNPFINALAAAIYIVVIVLIINAMTSFSSSEDTILIPMAMLSLFVLSAAVMGFLFVFEPTRLLLENKKQESVRFFAKTVGTFALFVVLFFAVLIYTLI